MSPSSPAAPAASPEALFRIGRWLLSSALGLGLLLIGLLAWQLPEALLLMPLALLGVGVLFFLFQYPLLNLCAVLAGFVLIADYAEGIQITEVVYGLYFIAFMAHWFTTRFFFYRDAVLRTPQDKALFLFLLFATLSIPLTFVFGGSVRSMFSEWTALMMFAFYYPVKEACVRERNGVRAVLIVLAWICLYVVARNLMTYQIGLQEATYLWQVVRGRVATNDSYMLIASMFSLVLLIFAERRWQSFVLLIAFLAFFSGLILTQSRGFWVAFVVGAAAMFFLVSGRHKRRLLTLSITGISAVIAVGLIFFGDLFALVLGGLINRFATLSTAATEDISLVNRFLESRAVWEHVRQNPILGHGMGVSYHFYDIAYGWTRVDTFLHNGYLALWYKFGLWGLGLMLFFLGGAVWRGLQVFWQRSAAPLLRLAGLCVALSLIAYALPAITSNPFYLNDSTFMLGVIAGLACGAHERARLVQADTGAPAA